MRTTACLRPLDCWNRGVESRRGHEYSSRLLHSFVLCCVGSGLCDGLIARSEGSYPSVVCVCACVTSKPKTWAGVGPIYIHTYIQSRTLLHSSKGADILCRYKRVVGRVAQSIYRLATGWTVRGSYPGVDEIFRTRPDRPWGPPSLLYNVHQVFLSRG
jgi:hypothetical protein